MEHLSNIKGIHNKILAGKLLRRSVWDSDHYGTDLSEEKNHNIQDSLQVLEILEFFKVTC